MITEEHVVRFFDQANPIPDVELLDMEQIGAARHLATLEQRSSDVTQLDTKTSDNKEKRKKAMAFLVAAAVVIVAGIGFMVLTQGDEVPLAAPALSVSVVVPGTEWWTDTGIDLSIDDMVSIEAEGAVTPSTDNEPHVGPDGVPDRPSAQVYNVEGLEEENHASLIGRIGESGAPFLVGSELSFTADTEGRLFLGINDESVKNNAGAFTATITVNSS